MRSPWRAAGEQPPRESTTRCRLGAARRFAACCQAAAARPTPMAPPERTAAFGTSTHAGMPPDRWRKPPVARCLSELAAAKIRGALALDTRASAAVLTPRTPEALARARFRSPSPAGYGDFPLDNSSWDKSDWHRDLFTQRLNEVAARVDPRTPEPLALARRRLERPSWPVAYGGPLDESSWDKSDWHRDLFAHRLNEVAARG